MHEMALAENMLTLIQDAQRAQGFTRVEEIWLEVGALAAVEPEALVWAWTAAARGTLAENAKLHLVPTPGRGRCDDCGEEFELAALYEACPACGNYRVTVIAGQALKIKDLWVV